MVINQYYPYIEYQLAEDFEPLTAIFKDSMTIIYGVDGKLPTIPTRFILASTGQVPPPNSKYLATVVDGYNQPQFIYVQR